MGRLVYIETYGCQMNKLDSEILSGILTGAGYTLTDEIETADVILMNTCSVREHAERRVLGRISQLHRLKKRKADLILGVLGCMAQRLGRRIVEEKDYVDLVVGPDSYRKLPSMIRDLTEDHSVSVELSPDSTENYDGIEPRREDGSRAWVAISRGCDNFCSYCIVPYTRGRERSRPPFEVLKEVSKLSAQGFKEVTLLGQNVNSYRYGDVRFADLLRMADRETDIPRARFLTSHPKDLSDDILEAIAESPSICEHIHLPLQSGSTRILEAMNRRYSAEQYLDVVSKARCIIPGLSLTTDVIAGFPGETEEDFERTVDLLEEVEFDYAFTYKYSPREGTKAFRMLDDVPPEEKQRRLDILIKLQQKITKKRNWEMIGSEEELLVEGVSRKDEDQLLARTRTDKPVVIDNLGGSLGVGSLVRAKIVGMRGVTLIGSVVRGQRSVVRGQRSEVRGQRSEVRDQRSEVRDQ